MSDVIERQIVHDLTASAARYAAASRGKGTRRAYESQWGQFVAWCDREGLDPYSGEATVALHIAGMADAGKSNSTIVVRMGAIRAEYRLAGQSLNMDDDVLAPVREGIARTIGTAPRRKAAPATAAVLRAMLATRWPSTAAQGARDRLLLLLGFGAALRRSELAALTVGDVVEIPGRGLRVTVRRSKTDQVGAGHEVSVCGNPTDTSFCPVVAWRRWMEHRITSHDMHCADRGQRPLLCSVDKAGQLSGERMHDGSIAWIIKESAAKAGLAAKDFSGHSLRRGILTEGAQAGSATHDLMRHARHKDPRVSVGYIDEANSWTNNVSGAVFNRAI